MKKDENREYRVLLTNGKVVYFTFRELRAFVLSPNVLCLCAILLVVMTSGHPYLFPTLPDVTSRLFYWILGIFLYLLLILPWGERVLKMWQSRFAAPMPLVIASAPLIGMLSVLMDLMPDVFGSVVPARGESLNVLGMVRNIVVAHVCEMIAFLWLLPLSRNAEPVADVPNVADDAAQFIRIAGRSLPLDSVRCVRNEEHYLVVKTTMGTLRLRARMNDLLMQVSDDDGIQAHRSFWVSTEEALELRGTTIMTRSGCVIPVSRYRMKAVRAWCERHGKPH
ncbi:hypothetical protein TRM7615_03236 [Falsiruegeria mediterranea M17]|jgi:LytTr DNA-binding domain|uniref:HTH LytTR-type domain-containing protein n=1 Tax=Falsiruegeria mediterranea M17 TaxID=1200281 RepID=A0A2R8CBC5_9RHOB|nr:hypothetical protein TRM7615_03236 [Falsiruegeria mediterranea M17]